jgi:hypothetical protein
MTEAKKLTKLVLKFFQGRAGFDEWWSSISTTDRKDIESDLEETLANTVPESPGKPLPSK